MGSYPTGFALTGKVDVPPASTLCRPRVDSFVVQWVQRIFGGYRGRHRCPSTPHLENNILPPNRFSTPHNSSSSSLAPQSSKHPTKCVCSFTMTSFGSDLLHEHLDTVTSICKFHAESRIGNFYPWHRSASVPQFCLSFQRRRTSTSTRFDIRNHNGKRAPILTPYGGYFYAHLRL